MRSSTTLLCCVVLGVVLAVVPTGGARAQGMRWLRDQRDLGFTAEDVELQRQAIRRALDENPDGEGLSWRNETTGHAGRVTPVTSFEQDGMRCRAFRLQFATTQTRRLDLRACQHPDGSWKTF